MGYLKNKLSLCLPLIRSSSDHCSQISISVNFGIHSNLCYIFLLSPLFFLHLQLIEPMKIWLILRIHFIYKYLHSKCSVQLPSSLHFSMSHRTQTAKHSLLVCVFPFYRDLFRRILGRNVEFRIFLQLRSCQSNLTISSSLRCLNNPVT